jgi:hypothetical protein
MTTIQPDNRPIGENTYLLCGKFRYNNEKYDITVPGGFINDGGSVPRWAWSISGLTPDGLARAGYVIHDYLYRFGLKTRSFADCALRDIMIDYGVPKRQAVLAYMATRIGGRKYYGSIVPPNTDSYETLFKETTEYYRSGVISTCEYNYAIKMINCFTNQKK